MVAMGVNTVFVGPDGYTQLMLADTEGCGRLVSALNLKAQ